MATRNRNVDLRTMLQDPAGAFRDSREVLDHPGLARAERLTVLLQWERGARGLSGGGGGAARVFLKWSRCCSGLSHLLSSLTGAAPSDPFGPNPFRPQFCH